MFSHVLIYDCILILILDLQKKLKEKIQKAQQKLDMEKVSQSHSSCCSHKLLQSKLEC